MPPPSAPALLPLTVELVSVDGARATDAAAAQSPALLPLTVELVSVTVVAADRAAAAAVATPPVSVRPSSVRSAVALKICTLSASVAGRLRSDDVGDVGRANGVSSLSTSPVMRMRPSPSMVTASVIDSVPPTVPPAPSPPSSRMVPLRLASKTMVSAPDPGRRSVHARVGIGGLYRLAKRHLAFGGNSIVQCRDGDDRHAIPPGRRVSRVRLCSP